MAVSPPLRTPASTQPKDTRLDRSHLWAALGSTLVIGSFGVLAWQSHHHGVNLLGYGVAVTVAWAGFLLAWLTARHGASLRWFWILSIALAARVSAGLSLPLLEDDPWRYLWDGYQTSVHGTPYGRAPAASFADPSVPATLQRVLDRINHPDLPTVYGPTAQAAFWLSYLIAPGQLWPWKALLFLVDLLVGWALLRSRVRGALVFWALCPLVLQSAFASAHVDGLAVGLTAGAFLAAAQGRAGTAAALLAAAVGARPIALLLAPWLLGRDRFAWGMLVAVGLLLHLPFLAFGGWGLSQEVRAALAGWEFNASVFSLTAFAFGPAPARFLCVGLFLLGWGWYAARALRNAPTLPSPEWLIAIPGDRIYGLLWLLSPVVNPWYLLWIAPFVAVRPSVWGVTSLAAITLSYATGLRLDRPELGNFEHPVWLRPLEYGLIALAVGIDVGRHRRRSAAARTNRG